MPDLNFKLQTGKSGFALNRWYHGFFEIVSHSPDGSFDAVLGSIVYHSGTITTLDTGAGCTNQQYLVTGALNDVTTTTSSISPGGNMPDTLVRDLAAPFSAASSSTGGEPPPQSPVFLLTGQ